MGEGLGYPIFMKPYDGGAWVGVSRIDNADQLQAAYEESGRRVMHLQRAASPWDSSSGFSGWDRRPRIIRYDPGSPLHERYTTDYGFVDAEEAALLEDMALTINSFFGWDFNSCESLRSEGGFCPIDFANACPDSQVTSLHYHFPWLVMAKVRWALFCAATKRPMRVNLDWDPYLRDRRQGLPYREALAGLRRHRQGAVRNRALLGVLRHHPRPTWTRWRTSSSAPPRRGRRSAPRSSPCSPSTSGISSPTTSGG